MQLRKGIESKCLRPILSKAITNQPWNTKRGPISPNSWPKTLNWDMASQYQSLCQTDARCRSLPSGMPKPTHHWLEEQRDPKEASHPWFIPQSSPRTVSQPEGTRGRGPIGQLWPRNAACHTLDNLGLWLEFPESTRKGISINRIIFRKSNIHIFFDSSKITIGGLCPQTWVGWGYKFTTEENRAFTLNIKEYIGSAVYTEIQAQHTVPTPFPCILNRSDNTSMLQTKLLVFTQGT